MDLVEAARLYLGTPFKHQGRYSYGVDCGGLLILAAREMGIYLQDIQGYHRMPDDTVLKQALDDQLIKTSRGANNTIYGDVLLMAFRKHPQHIAIRTDKGIIHAHEDSGGVVEHGLDDRWLKRIKGVYILG